MKSQHLACLILALFPRRLTRLSSTSPLVSRPVSTQVSEIKATTDLDCSNPVDFTLGRVLLSHLGCGVGENVGDVGDEG